MGVKYFWQCISDRQQRDFFDRIPGVLRKSLYSDKSGELQIAENCLADLQLGAAHGSTSHSHICRIDLIVLATRLDMTTDGYIYSLSVPTINCN